jgi:hypothetical protein
VRPPPPLGFSLRIRDYEARARAAKLTVVEQQEYEQLKADHERARANLALAEKREEETREARRQESVRLAVIAFPTLATDAAAREEFDIYAKRIAKLTRARAVAEADGRTDLFVRIDGLLSKERQRHDAWVAAHKH